MSNSTKPPQTSLPPDIRSDFNGDILQNTAIAFTVLETVFVALRYLAWYLSANRFRIDDILILPAYISCLGLNICDFLTIRLGGVGYHIAKVEIIDPGAISHLFKLVVSIDIIYAFACGFPRLVLLATYLKIFPTRSERVACYSLSVLVVAYTIAQCVSQGVECVPLQKIWDPAVPGYCIPHAAYYDFITLPNLFFDIAMLILPLPAIWRLQTSRRNKVGFSLILLTGSLGIITAIIRTVTVFEFSTDFDATWSSSILLSRTLVEPGVYLIAACLPSYAPLLQVVRSGGTLARRRPDKPNRSAKYFQNSFLRNRRQRRLDDVQLTEVGEEQAATQRTHDEEANDSDETRNASVNPMLTKADVGQDS